MEELKATLRKAVIANKIFPVYTGSALKNKGVQLVLDAVVDYLPSPTRHAAGYRHQPQNMARIERHAETTSHFARSHSNSRQTRSWGSSPSSACTRAPLRRVHICTTQQPAPKSVFGRIVRLQANQREEVKKVYAGEIAAAVGLKDTRTSHTLCDENNPIILEQIKFPEPVISLRIEPKTKADQEKMGMAMKKLADEDPTFKVSTDAENYGDAYLRHG
jgi:elongation factor G